MFNKKYFFVGLVGVFFFTFWALPVRSFSPKSTNDNGGLILAQANSNAPGQPASGLKGSVTKLNTIGASYGGTSAKTLPDLVGGIIKIILTLLGVIFFILTVYGGYKWMLARGDSKEVETAKDIITRALIGLIIVLAAYAITYFVVARLTTEAGLTIK